MNIDGVSFGAELLFDVIIMFAARELVSGGGKELMSPLIWIL